MIIFVRYFARKKLKNVIYLFVGCCPGILLQCSLAVNMPRIRLISERLFYAYK